VTAGKPGKGGRRGARRGGRPAARDAEHKAASAAHPAKDRGGTGHTERRGTTARRGAAREDEAARARAAREQARREIERAAERTEAAREAAARAQAAHEAAEREVERATTDAEAARDAMARAQAARDTADRDVDAAEARARTAHEQAAREIDREAARVAAARAEAAREIERVDALRSAAQDEAARAEAAARDARAAREQAQHEIDQVAREVERARALEAAARDQAAHAEAAQDDAERELEQAAALQSAAQEEEAGAAAARAAAAREIERARALEAAARDQAAHAEAAHDGAEREIERAAARTWTAHEEAARAEAVREQAAREAESSAVRAGAAHDAAEREIERATALRAAAHDDAARALSVRKQAAREVERAEALQAAARDEAARATAAREAAVREVERAQALEAAARAEAARAASAREAAAREVERAEAREAAARDAASHAEQAGAPADGGAATAGAAVDGAADHAGQAATRTPAGAELRERPDGEREPEIDPPDPTADLARAWGRPAGLVGWLCDVDHKAIGRRYIVTAFVFLALGGVLALIMRLQLARPDQHLVGPDLYDQLFTTHGSTMMFLFAVPVLQGFGVYLVPLMVGTRNLAFPRLNAYGYWAYLIGAVLLWVGLVTNTGPDAGWFAYVPLAGPQYGTGKRMDVWAQMITFTELSALAVAINLITTILKHRAPGMALHRMPMFVWAQLITSVMVVFAMPAVMLSSGMLAADRLVATQFFNPAEGGDPLLWQHLFWYFAHPEVYIIFIPALGFVSSILVPFARTPLFGYPVIVLTMATTAFIGFGVWVHHMFATGLPQLGQSFFTAASLLITIPTGIQFFLWIATLWRGRIRLATPMLFVLAFFATFLIGGLTGVMLASVPLDLQVHDTFFVVAHLHYVLIGGSVFPLLGAVYYWFPKLTGRMLDERAGRLSCALVFAGFHLTFFPMHQLGLDGMPRRIFTYDEASGWGPLNLVATIGAMVLGAGFLVTLGNALWARRRGAIAGADPWLADGTEWRTASPPPVYNFAFLPTVRDRYPAWTSPPDQPVVHGVRTDRPELLVTGAVDAEPDHRTELPGPTLAPLAAALATGATFIGSIFTPWAVPVGGALVTAALVAWFWPRRPHRAERMEGAP
jgi:cytochrome c oxidase subunit I